jgi:hypothetical protein
LGIRKIIGRIRALKNADFQFHWRMSSSPGFVRSSIPGDSIGEPDERADRLVNTEGRNATGACLL